MEGKCIYCKYPVTYAVVFHKGDDFSEGIKQFAEEHHLAASRITGVGSFSDVTLGYYDRGEKKFKEIQVDEQVEVLSLLGDISLEDGEPKVHVHAVIGKSDGTAHGGHVRKAHVWPTLELIITEVPAHLRRRYDPESGLMLIDLRESTVERPKHIIEPELEDIEREEPIPD